MKKQIPRLKVSDVVYDSTETQKLLMQGLTEHARESAKQLLVKFMRVMPRLSPIPRTSSPSASYKKVKYIQEVAAKECALICVGEILKEVNVDSPKYNYLQVVKNELEKL